MKKLAGVDYVLLLCALALSTLSVVTLLSISGGVLSTRVIVQISSVFLGVACMYVISTLDYQDICEKFAIPFFIASMLILAATLVFGEAGDLGGGRSWINIPGVPFNIQPSEFVKLLFIITFAVHLDRVKEKINKPLILLLLFAHGGIIIGLVLLQKDLGTALVYMVIFVSMLFAAGISLWYLLGLAALAVIALPIIWPHLDEFRQMRILVGFNPELDPQNYGYQQLRSIAAVSAGGFWGQGFSGGTQFQSVPTNQTDFIFAVISEKFGFFGCMIMLLIMLVFVIRIISIARRARKGYSSFICIGIVSVIIAQAIENIGMCLGMLPVIGITLPFLSYGGSSVLSLYLMLGVLQSIYVHKKKYYFEREPL